MAAIFNLLIRLKNHFAKSAASNSTRQVDHTVYGLSTPEYQKAFVLVFISQWPLADYLFLKFFPLGNKTRLDEGQAAVPKRCKIRWRVSGHDEPVEIVPLTGRVATFNTLGVFSFDSPVCIGL